MKKLKLWIPLLSGSLSVLAVSAVAASCGAKKEETKNAPIEKDKTPEASKLTPAPTPKATPTPAPAPKPAPKKENPVQPVQGNPGQQSKPKKSANPVNETPKNPKNSENPGQGTPTVETPTTPKPGTGQTPPSNKTQTPPAPKTGTEAEKSGSGKTSTTTPGNDTHNETTSSTRTTTAPKTAEENSGTAPKTGGETTNPVEKEKAPATAINNNEVEAAKQALKTLLDAKTTEVAKYNDAKYADIKTTLEAAYAAAEGKKDSTSKEELTNAKTALETAVQKASSDKTAKDIDEAKKALKTVLDKKTEELAKYTIADAKYSLDAVKTKLEQAFTAGQTAHDKQQTTVDELNSAKTTLESVITEANSSKTELVNLYNETRTAILSRFNKMFEYKAHQGINLELFDKYNQASVDFYNEGNKLNKDKLQSIKTKIDEALKIASDAKASANVISTEIKLTKNIPYSVINEVSSNNSADYAIDGNIDLSIPFYGANGGTGAVGKSAEVLFKFTVPTTIKSVRLHQYQAGNKVEAIYKLAVHGLTHDNRWEQIGTIETTDQTDEKLRTIENVTVTIPEDKKNTKYKIVTLKSVENTSKWWGIRDVEILNGEGTKLYFQDPVVVSSAIYPIYYLDEKRLIYKDPAPEGKTYKKENLLDNNIDTFNTYKHGANNQNKSLKGDSLYFDFLKPMNVHSIKLIQDAVLKVTDITVTLTAEDNSTVTKKLSDLNTEAMFNLSTEEVKKKYKRMKIENSQEGNSTSFWQINEIEIL
ncbi:hypothetical protein [Mycoplasma nasistruthionis]|uniref:F5/8 type C domain-containing protein n=1 Tax=Mycoplasma nasistruthionis TaxID=353852 RepID=A0A4Y6I7Q0_9MOLU|nr:hypothetical protein [Mycoplasma nasistruthionis]QDF65229.1 hypothetical protein FIV53_02975 [Mycoplasma nasistruthionis]